MNSIPMVYVNPITGPHAGKERFCYVCALGSEPVISVFVKPEALDKLGLFEAIQQLSDNHSKLQAFVVCLSGPGKNLQDKLRTLAHDKNLTIPLTLLPDEGSLISIYQSLPLSPEAEITVLLYRGRQLVKKTEVVNFSDMFSPNVSSGFKGLNTIHTFGAESATTASDIGGQLNIETSLTTTSAFQELDDAAKAMIEAY